MIQPARGPVRPLGPWLARVVLAPTRPGASAPPEPPGADEVDGVGRAGVWLGVDAVWRRAGSRLARAAWGDRPVWPSRVGPRKYLVCRTVPVAGQGRGRAAALDGHPARRGSGRLLMMTWDITLWGRAVVVGRGPAGNVPPVGDGE